MKRKNKWYVLSGAVSSGKTTIIKLLENEGYKVIHETPTIIISQEMKNGKTLDDIRRDEVGLQKKILEMKLAIEERLDPNEIVFFDRGIPDSVAFFKNGNLPTTELLQKALREVSYKKIFILDRLPLEHTNIRNDVEEVAANEDKLHRETYSSLSFPVVTVPVMSVEKRLQFIIDNL